MAKRKSTASRSDNIDSRNPLISSDRPVNTLERCINVLAYLRTRRMVDFGGEPSDDEACKMEIGRSLLFDVIEHALEYESNRIGRLLAAGRRLATTAQGGAA